MNSSKVQKLIDISKASGNKAAKEAAERVEAFINQAEEQFDDIEVGAKSIVAQLRSSKYWEYFLVAVGLVVGLIVGLSI